MPGSLSEGGPGLSEGAFCADKVTVELNASTRAGTPKPMIFITATSEGGMPFSDFRYFFTEGLASPVFSTSSIVAVEIGW